MLRGTSLQQPKSFLLRQFLVILITAGLSSCNGVVPSAVSQLTQINECTPPINVNIYIPTPTIVPTSTPISNPIIATPTEQPAPISKQSAFQMLELQVRTWTDIESFNMDDTSQARIIVTFLSPDLIRAVTMNEALLADPTDPDIQTKTRMGLEQIASREKLIFLLTVLSINTNGTAAAHTFAIPAGEIKLLSANNLDISPVYFDQNLDQPVGLSQYNFGYLYYPLAVVHDQTCIEVLNSKFDTNIILKTSSITVDGAASGPMTWTIEYKPLLDIGHTNPVVGGQNSYYESDPLPTDIPPNMLDISDTFWREYAKFVWGHLTP